MSIDFEKIARDRGLTTEQYQEQLILAHAKMVGEIFEKNNAPKDISIEMLPQCNSEYSMRVVCKRVYLPNKKKH